MAFAPQQETPEVPQQELAACASNDGLGNQDAGAQPLVQLLDTIRRVDRIANRPVFVMRRPRRRWSMPRDPSQPRSGFVTGCPRGAC